MIYNKIKLEFGISDNSGYPNNVKKVIEIETVKSIEEISEMFSSLERSSKTYLVSFGINKDQNNSFYIEVDPKTTYRIDDVLNLLKEFDIDIKEIESIK